MYIFEFQNANSSHKAKTPDISETKKTGIPPIKCLLPIYCTECEKASSAIASSANLKINKVK